MQLKKSCHIRSFWLLTYLNRVNIDFATSKIERMARSEWDNYNIQSIFHPFPRVWRIPLSPFGPKWFKHTHTHTQYVNVMIHFRSCPVVGHVLVYSCLIWPLCLLFPKLNAYFLRTRNIYRIENAFWLSDIEKKGQFEKENLRDGWLRDTCWFGGTILYPEIRTWAKWLIFEMDHLNLVF